MKFSVLLLACCLYGHAVAQDTSRKPARAPAAGIDLSGQPQRGKASYYGKKFAGRTMADGTPMDPESNIAASRTLPLGARALVTNLKNGKSAVVEIRDRGPYVDGRIVDLTPATAKKLGFHREGVAHVLVTPIEFPNGEPVRGIDTLAAND